MNANDKCLMSALDSVDILLISVQASLTAADMISVRASIAVGDSRGDST